MAIQERELMTVPEPLPMTFREFLTWDGGDYEDLASYAEWVNGFVSVYGLVTAEHSALAQFLRVLIQTWAEEREVGRVYGEPFGMFLRQTPAFREPDIFFAANANRGRVRTHYLEGPADLVIEVVMDNSRTRDTVEKRAEYQRHGVAEYWIIDYLREQAMFLQLDDQGRYQAVLPDAAGVYHCRALPGLWLQISWLWQNPLPNYLAVYRAWGLN